MRLPSVLAFALVFVTPVAGQQRFAGRIAAVVDSLRAAAAARGLPIDPVIEKAIEGSAKGVPAERVTAALRAVVDQLDTAAASSVCESPERSRRSACRRRKRSNW